MKILFCMSLLYDILAASFKLIINILDKIRNINITIFIIWTIVLIFAFFVVRICGMIFLKLINIIL